MNTLTQHETLTPVQSLIKELGAEAITTRKMLERVPTDKFDWQPHAKSMTVRRLVNHIAELPGWVMMVLTSEELDFDNNKFAPESWATIDEVLAYFDRSYKAGHEALALATEEDLEPFWTLRKGSYIISKSSKAEVIRMAFSQTVHHRAQLGVFLRLLNIPIPGSYGPSADEL